MVFLNSQTETEDFEKNKINIAEQMRSDYGSNIMIEFIEDSLHIDTFFDDIKNNDLHIAAIFGAKLIIDNRKLEIIKKFSVSHLKALALAAKNIVGNINVGTKNQLKLNTEILSKYKNNSQYEEEFNRWNDNQKVYCLNYGDRDIGTLHELPDSVNAIMRVKFNEYDNCCKFFKQISMPSKKRNCVWNGFQEGISGMYQLESELEELLLKEYEL